MPIILQPALRRCQALTKMSVLLGTCFISLVPDNITNDYATTPKDKSIYVNLFLFHFLQAITFLFQFI